MTSLTRNEVKAMYSTAKARDLSEAFEGLQQALGGVYDLKTNPDAIYNADLGALIETHITAGLQEALSQTVDGSERVFMEGLTDDADEVATPMEAVDAHMHNIRQLLENSLIEGRAHSANLRNVNELTPLDAFIPLLIVRSYLPLCGKDMMPYVVPKMPFIRFKELQKWIVTKDGKKYLRPDVYSDTGAVEDIINSGKGRKVSDLWYPLGEDVPTGDDVTKPDATYMEMGDEGVEVEKVVPTDPLRIEGIDLLEASGGNRNIGDALSEDVYLEAARGVVTASDGKTYVVEQAGLDGYYDVTSYTPQRSISVEVTYTVHIKAADGGEAKDETFVDRIYGSYNAETATFELVSNRGYTKQVKFGGNLSNKNNMEYISFSNDFRTYQHVIPEGIRSNFPITYEDTRLYRETANFDIIANAVAEMNEIFINLEDSSVVGTIERCWRAFEGREDHNCLRFQGQKVAWRREVDLERDATRHFKNLEYIQDELQYAISRSICDIRTVCAAEAFKVHLVCNPNVASMFVGDNFSWKVQPGAAIADNIRADYNMGIYTAQGDSMRVVATQKVVEDDGIIMLVQPVNEENFMTWKHFKRALFFDKNHRIQEMPNNPNIMGVATFHTHPYIPFQVRVLPENYK